MKKMVEELTFCKQIGFIGQNCAVNKI